MQARIADSAYAAQQAIERGESVVVGVNKFAEDGASERSIPLQRIDDAIEREQVARLRAFRAARDARARRGAARRRAHAPPRASDNLMPHFVEAVDAGATLGEICNVLRDVFGVYRAKEVVAMKIDHIAIVVKDLEATMRLYTQTLGFQPSLSRDDRRSGRRGGRLGGRRLGHRTAASARSRLADRALPRRRRDETPPHRLSRRRHRDGARRL